MARPRTKPAEPADTSPSTQDDPGHEEPLSGKTVSMKWKGPSGQHAPKVGMLTNGKTYDVPKEIADKLARGSMFWEKA